jgi:Mg2+/Co2+ transporter CorB
MVVSLMKVLLSMLFSKLLIKLSRLGEFGVLLASEVVIAFPIIFFCSLTERTFSRILRSNYP